MFFATTFALLCAAMQPSPPDTSKTCSGGYHIRFGKYQECGPGIRTVVKGRDFYCDPKDNTTQKIEDALLKDGLITDAGNYSFTFTTKTLTVNGKQQTPETWERYKKLIEDSTGHAIGKGYSYVITKNSTE